MALRFLVEEELTSHLLPLTSHLLLTAYTNRAVDEICSMLEDAGIDYLRVGYEASCDPRFADRLTDRVIARNPRLDDIRQHIQDTRVIVSTTSMLQSRSFLLEMKHFSLCIVDEASQILEPNIIGLLTSDSIDRFILIGDHKQLPAVVQQPDDDPSLHDCRLSLFERLLRQEHEAGREAFTAILRRQGRMHPDIAAFPNEFFYAREHLLPVPLPHQEETELDYRQPSEDHLDDLLKQHRVLFFPIVNDSLSIINSSDKVNPAEATLVADLLRRIHRQYGERFDAAKTVGVIVPYRNQIAMIRREIAKLDIPQLLDISIDTVERYQGSQRDVIIYSFTIHRPYQLDFLTANCFEEDDGEYQSFGRTIDRKLNVAMTRARKQLLMTGKADVLQQNSIFKELILRYSI
jgi:superfamily I DNA and/or RNA helicase